jgi:hypothetical protein
VLKALLRSHRVTQVVAARVLDAAAAARALRDTGGLRGLLIVGLTAALTVRTCLGPPWIHG